jgi:hypothetical protein
VVKFSESENSRDVTVKEEEGRRKEEGGEKPLYSNNCH